MSRYRARSIPASLERGGVGESFDHGGDEEIAAELDEVSLRRLVGDDEGALTKGLE